MKLAMTSDLHGHLPPFIPEVDVLVIAGDVAPDLHGTDAAWQADWMFSTFAPWLASLNARHIVATPGNHDWWAWHKFDSLNTLPWILLQDNYCDIEGVRFYGCPWSLTFGPYPFMADDLARYHENIPQCDVLLSHGPMWGYGDLTYRRERVGAPTLNTAVDRVKPKVLVTGHIHEDAGVWTVGDTMVVSNCYVDINYRPKRDPRVVELL